MEVSEISKTGPNDNIQEGVSHQLPELQALDMYVVDVQKMCIKFAPAKCGYFALSYVWGTSEFIRLTKGISQSVTSQGALSQLQLPRTISEAIGITKFLNERYLWVDVLCIIQGDEASKTKQIVQMDKIFLSAALTIVGASGEDVHTGLTGCKPHSRRTEQHIEVIQGLQFALMGLSLNSELKSTKWYSRGWTYQEFMLSKRLLTFSHRYVSFQCHMQSFTEDHHRR